MVEKIMTLTEYARHKDVELRAVKRAIEEGRLPPEVIKIGSNGRKLIYVASADKCWDENTIINNQNERRQKSFNLGEKQPPREGPEEDQGLTGPKLVQYRTAREGYQAQILKLEFEEKIGSLVSAEAVKKAARETATNVKNTLLNMPDALSPLLARETNIDKIHKMLTDEVHRLLTTMSRGEFDQFKKAN